MLALRADVRDTAAVEAAGDLGIVVSTGEGAAEGVAIQPAMDQMRIWEE